MYSESIFLIYFTNINLFAVVPVGMWVTHESYPSYPQAFRRKIRDAFSCGNYHSPSQYNITIVAESIKKGRGHFTVIKHLRPFSKGEVCRNDHGRFFINL